MKGEAVHLILKDLTHGIWRKICRHGDLPPVIAFFCWLCVSCRQPHWCSPCWWCLEWLDQCNVLALGKQVIFLTMFIHIMVIFFCNHYHNFQSWFKIELVGKYSRISGQFSHSLYHRPRRFRCLISLLKGQRCIDHRPLRAQKYPLLLVGIDKLMPQLTILKLLY